MSQIKLQNQEEALKVEIKRGTVKAALKKDLKGIFEFAQKIPCDKTN